MHIPVPIQIASVVIIFLFILLIVVIRRRQRRLIWQVVILLLLAVGFAVQKGLYEYNRTNVDILKVKANINIAAIELIHQYEANDSVANAKYLGQVIETSGNIKKIEQDERGYYTVILGDTSSLSSVRCSMDTTHNEDAAHLTAGSSATVRGACTGFNKDEMGLGSDVILNRCAIVKNNK